MIAPRPKGWGVFCCVLSADKKSTWETSAKGGEEERAKGKGGKEERVHIDKKESDSRKPQNCTFSVRQCASSAYYCVWLARIMRNIAHHKTQHITNGRFFAFSAR